MAEPAPGERLLEFLEVMRRLRVECSWKAGQTHRSLARYLLEETHETLEAIDTGDLDHLREELGDLLLQVYFHAVIAEEAGEFTIDDVASDIIDKMHRRNPHVFPPPGGERAPGGDAETINEVWESIKAQEKQRESVVDGLPPGLPALLYADKVLDRLERAGAPASSGVSTGSTDVGDRLLDLVAEARLQGVDPEQALRDAVRRLLTP
jgi:XTP/dITP diphosphohydrolase